MLVDVGVGVGDPVGVGVGVVVGVGVGVAVGQTPLSVNCEPSQSLHILPLERYTALV